MTQHWSRVIRRTLCAVAAVAAVAASGPLMLAHAQPAVYPSRAIKMVVPFPPGGITDVGARLIARKLGEQLAQPIVIENKAGAGGNVGAEQVAHAEPDGYTVFFGPQGTMVSNQFLYKSMGFDPARDFIAVHEVFAAPIVIVTSDMKFKTLKDVIDYARANPGKLAFASAGNGTFTHLSAEFLQSVTGVKMLHVPYRGSTPAITDLLAGNVPLAFDYGITTVAHVRAGKLRALAVNSGERLPLMPEVPTLREIGYAAGEAVPWTGLFVPRNTPAATVERLQAAMAVVMADKEVAVELGKLGAIPLNLGKVRFADFVVSERVKWKEVIQKSGASLE